MSACLRHPKWFLLSCLLLLAPLACSPTAPGHPSLLEFERNRAHWENTRPDRYEMELTWSCFCSLPGPMPLRIEVEGDSVRSVTGAASDTEAAPALSLEAGQTVDDLFNTLLWMIGSEPDHLEVAWHPQFRFPAEIHFDGRFSAADDEVYYRVEGFTPRD